MPQARSGLQPGRPPVKPRRPARTSPERKARDLLVVRSGGWCEVCGNAPAREYQHRVGRAHCSGQPREWDVRNALHVCGRGNYAGCHGDIHQNPAWAMERGWMVASWRDEATVPCLRRGEWVWLTPGGGVVPLSQDELAGLGGAA